MNILAIKATIFLFVGFLNFLLALLIWIKGKTKATLHLGLAAFFSSIFVCGSGFAYVWADSPDLRLFFLRLTWIGVLGVSSSAVFVYYFIEQLRHVKIKSFFLYLGGAVITFLAVTTPYFTSETYIKGSLISIGTPGPLDVVGRVFVVLCLTFILIKLIKYYREAAGFKKRQTKYFIYGLSVYIFASIIGTGLAPLIFKTWGADLPAEISSLFSFLWVGLTSYAILKKELFEIKVVLTDLLVGIIGVILLTLVFIMPTGTLKILVGAVLILFCFFGYYLIKAVYEEGKRREEAERLAQKEAKIREEAERFKKVSVKLKERITQVLDLKEVVSRIADTLIETFGIDKISFALKQPSSEFYQFQKTIGFLEKELTSLIRDTAICSYLKMAKNPLIKEELKATQDILERNKVGLLLPLFQKQMLTGIIFLGEKPSNVPYSKEDIDLLGALSYQISISINNALSYEEIKKDKEVLEKFYRLTVGREVKMAELKKKNEELEEKLKGREEAT